MNAVMCTVVHIMGTKHFQGVTEFTRQKILSTLLREFYACI